MNNLKRNLILVVIVIGAIIMYSTISDKSVIGLTEVSTKKIESSPQFLDGKFNHIENSTGESPGGMFSAMWKFFFSDNERTPETSVPVVPADLSYFNNGSDGDLNVTWLGHSSLMINIDGFRLLTDPVFEKRISIFGPTRYNGDVPVNPDLLEDIDVVLISHDHYDHLNKFSIKKLIPVTRQFLVPLGVGKRIVDWGVPESKITELDWWDEYGFNDSLKFAATPVQHFSGRGLFDRNETLALSWVIISENFRLFFSGDSGYFPGFKSIGDEYGPFDMTFMECGAYNENWANIHMFPEETVRAHIDLKGEILHPIHWGTFNLALHPWYEPMERATAAAESLGVKIITPVTGETTIYGKHLPVQKWWRQGNINVNGILLEKISVPVKKRNTITKSTGS